MKREEQKTQEAFVEWFHLQYPNILIWHTPNGGYRNVIEAAKFKRMGVLSGVPDIFIPCPRNNSHGLFIELKSTKGKITNNQRKVISKLMENNYIVCICSNIDSAITAVKAYFG
jgi:hypothetical protein